MTLTLIGLEMFQIDVYAEYDYFHHVAQSFSFPKMCHNGSVTTF